MFGEGLLYRIGGRQIKFADGDSPRRHQPALSQMTRTALIFLVQLLVLPAISWAASDDHALPPPTLDDEFNSLPLHYRPSGRDTGD